MNITGITAEYNPLHEGHIYHIKETRRQTGCDVLVVAMSGNFVQRGEPAIFDKWIRAGHALNAGADLIVEIPSLFCLGNASQYASASVRILETLGCEAISFGSGSGDIKTISEVAGVLAANREQIGSYISAMIKEGKSYPAARFDAYRTLRAAEVSDDELDRELAVLSEPNDILALEYITNMRFSHPLVIKRQGAYHEGTESEDEGYRSAEYIRKVINSEGACDPALSGYVPKYVLETIASEKPLFPNDCFDILKYSILSADPDSIDECPSGGEGLGNLLKAAVKEADSYDDLVMRVKSKRYTYTRLSRLCMQTMLGISREKYSFDSPGYIRVLGHNEKGRELLAHIRNISKDEDKDLNRPAVITNINKETEKLDKAALDQLELDIHAGEIYQLLGHSDGQKRSERRMRPVMA